MNNKILISVIIPLYNGGEKFMTCFERLAEQSFVGVYEIIIVDDISTDESVQLVENKKTILREKVFLN